MLLPLLSLVIGSRQLQPFFVNSQYWNVMLYHPMAEIQDALSPDMEKVFWGFGLSSPYLRCVTHA